MADHKSPKEYTIPSRDYGITASEAADVLTSAQEIHDNKPLNNAALKMLRKQKKTVDKII